MVTVSMNSATRQPPELAWKKAMLNTAWSRKMTVIKISFTKVVRSKTGYIKTNVNKGWL